MFSDKTWAEKSLATPDTYGIREWLTDVARRTTRGVRRPGRDGRLINKQSAVVIRILVVASAADAQVHVSLCRPNDIRESPAGRCYTIETRQ